MERIKQKIAEPINVVATSELIYIEQYSERDMPMDVIQLEKSSIPELIKALQKFTE